MSKKRHECRVCGDTFPSITEHMIHVTEQHDLRRTGGTDRTRRSWTCRSCGTGWCSFDAPECTHCGRVSTEVAAAI